jgi:hypothetical protein
MGSTRLLILSLISVIFWIRWNERNRVMFSQSEMMSFNSFVLKVSHIFPMWSGIKFSLVKIKWARGNHWLNVVPKI